MKPQINRKIKKRFAQIETGTKEFDQEGIPQGKLKCLGNLVKSQIDVLRYGNFVYEVKLQNLTSEQLNSQTLIGMVVRFWAYNLS